MKFKLQSIYYMPKEMEPGILYFSEEFGIAIHLCACGCGSKIKTPISPTEWSIKETERGPSLFPSIGNWQEACQSHYWIQAGQIKWSEKWSPEEIEAGRQHEQQRRQAYYESLEHRRAGFLQRIWRWITSRFKLF